MLVDAKITVALTSIRIQTSALCQRRVALYSYGSPSRPQLHTLSTSRVIIDESYGELPPHIDLVAHCGVNAMPAAMHVFGASNDAIRRELHCQ